MNSKSGPGNQLIILMLLMFIMFFLFGNQDIVSWIAVTLNSVFYPIIGFKGTYPVLTITLAGVLAVFLSSFFNNLFTDWKKMGETQELSQAFQKEILEARKAGNTNKINKLMKTQPEIMKRQMDAQKGMMKPMLFLFIFIAPIFMWLRYFLGGLDYYYFTVPWENGISLFDKPFLMQSWLWLYMIFSSILGQIMRAGMKWISMSDWWKKIKSNIKSSLRQ